jgi:NAD(P)-dependent dehydrogenase (short-subunit alcohol dehydrogenase family)
MHVILACRNKTSCLGAKARLDERHSGRAAQQLGGTCECRHLDLEDFSSIRDFAAHAPELDVLINNAGVMGVPPAADGSDAHLRPNHLGPHLLTRLLLPRMAPNARIVTVGSEAHYRGSLAFSHAPDGTPCLQTQRLWHWYLDYARSKLCNLLMTAELARRLQRSGSSVTAHCVSPGRVATQIFRNAGPAVMQRPLNQVLRTVFQTPEQVRMQAWHPKARARAPPAWGQ